MINGSPSRAVILALDGSPIMSFNVFKPFCPFILLCEIKLLGVRGVANFTLG